MQAPEVAPGGLPRYVPILGWLPSYPRGWLRFDLVAGLTAAAVVIPQAMAYASLAGLPVEAQPVRHEHSHHLAAADKVAHDQWVAARRRGQDLRGPDRDPPTGERRSVCLF